MLPTGNLSFQMSQPIRSSNDMSVPTDTIKCFLGQMGEKYSFKKKSNSQHEIPKLPEPTLNEVMESITTNEDYSTTQEPRSNATNEDNLMKLFNQFSSLTLPMSD